MSWAARLVVLLSIGVIVAALSIVGFVFFVTSSNNQVIVSNASIGVDWSEFEIETQSYAKYRDQSILLDIEGIQDPSGNAASDLVLTDGPVLVPEIELLDSHGNVVRFKRSGLTMKDKVFVVFRPKVNLSSESRFERIRIKGNSPFVCRSVIWRDYDPK